jgi:hypothetical protein
VSYLRALTLTCLWEKSWHLIENQLYHLVDEKTGLGKKEAIFFIYVCSTSSHPNVPLIIRSQCSVVMTDMSFGIRCFSPLNPGFFQLLAVGSLTSCLISLIFDLLS